MRRNKNHVPRDRALWRRAIFCYVIICELYAGSRSVETEIGSTNRCNFRIQFKIAAIGFLFCFLFLAASGCSTFNALEKRSFVNDSQSVQLSGQQVEVQRGRPRPIIDAAGRFFGLPNRLAIGVNEIDNHSISQATEMEIINYLEQNRLESVLVRSNQYAPLGELKRMVANDRIRPIWKSTFGTYNLLKYTLLPGRLLGGDWYNPYSNSLHIYSDVPTLGIARAAYAQDVQTRVNPGAYAAIKDIPFAGLSHETTATQLALQWYEDKPNEIEAAREILLPSYGASVGGQLGSFVPYGEVFGRVLGGGAGQIASKIRNRRSRR